MNAIINKQQNSEPFREHMHAMYVVRCLNSTTGVHRRALRAVNEVRLLLVVFFSPTPRASLTLLLPWYVLFVTTNLSSDAAI